MMEGPLVLPGRVFLVRRLLLLVPVVPCAPRQGVGGHRRPAALVVRLERQHRLAAVRVVGPRGAPAPPGAGGDQRAGEPTGGGGGVRGGVVLGPQLPPVALPRLVREVKQASPHHHVVPELDGADGLQRALPALRPHPRRHRHGGGK
ncbi:MAG: hypothetical protein D6692_14755 [Planctomycetota bacterium]|nr:MAG: hypothetical protein D6692_14755 [Planctomycetota bacterium]